MKSTEDIFLSKGDYAERRFNDCANPSTHGPMKGLAQFVRFLILSFFIQSEAPRFTRFINLSSASARLERWSQSEVETRVANISIDLLGVCSWPHPIVTIGDCMISTWCWHAELSYVVACGWAVAPKYSVPATKTFRLCLAYMIVPWKANSRLRFLQKRRW